jgi:ABC-type lipoprotein release transport system permease subunit
MRAFLEVARTGLTSVVLHPVRSAVTVAALVSVLLPYLAGLGISRGIREDAEAAIRHGADLYVSAVKLGKSAPIPLDSIKEIQDIPGVISVTPRIVGRIELGKDRTSAVLVGIPVRNFPESFECVDGRLYRGGTRNELVIGTDLARRLSLDVGDVIPPFYRNARGERISEVVGIFESDVAIWQARLIVTSFETAAHILDQPGLATDLLIRCQPGFETEIARTIERTLKLDDERPRVVTRDELSSIVPQGPRQRGGAFTAVYVLAFSVGVLVVLVTSGFGQSERRREIGILKAVGWQSDQLLLRCLVENLALSVCGAALAIIGAFVWLRIFNGWWIAQVLLNGVDRAPAFQIPFRLGTQSVLIAFLVAAVVVLTGSLFSTWKAAITPPRHSMR